MNNTVTPSRWFQGWRTAPRPAQLDPADLGTAWGLDASFDDRRSAPRAPHARAWSGWMRLLSSRAKRPT